MSKSGDTEIKLFGSLFSVHRFDPSSLSPVSDQSKEASSSYSSSSSSPPTGSPTVLADKTEQENSRFNVPHLLSDLNEHPKAVSEIPSPGSSKNNTDQQSEITTSTTTSADKPTTLKKPDKILPCPRCESANTKFCYYNNYNVNQPRYFCRNCQRYWTAGGSMRNVPVGSGRRKNKGWASSNHYLHVTSEEFDNTDNNNSGTILSFGSSESSVTETGKRQSGDAKITADSVSQEDKTHQGFLPPQVMVPNNWPYQWTQTGPPNANFYPIPFYWGCTSVPIWPTPETSPCLAKRSRDQTEEGTKDTTTTRAKLVSGSLKISEATKSSMWSKLPSKPEKKTEGFSLFNGFETKGSNRRSLVPEPSLSLQANPAAMSRSMNFRESMQQ